MENSRSTKVDVVLEDGGLLGARLVFWHGLLCCYYAPTRLRLVSDSRHARNGSS